MVAPRGSDCQPRSIPAPCTHPGATFRWLAHSAGQGTHHHPLDLGGGSKTHLPFPAPETRAGIYTCSPVSTQQASPQHPEASRSHWTPPSSQPVSGACQAHVPSTVLLLRGTHVPPPRRILCPTTGLDTLQPGRMVGALWTSLAPAPLGCPTNATAGRAVAVLETGHDRESSRKE